MLTSGAAVTVAQGGTGLATLTANNVLLGNGTSAPTFVAPSTSGNILTSNGSAWVSQAPAGGGVTSLNGQTGAITNTDLYAIGSYVMGRPANISAYSVNTTVAGSILYATCSVAGYTTSSGWVQSFGSAGATLVNTGTWRCVSPAGAASSFGNAGLWVRIS
jgi:hypothetical protein